ncbi:copper homeostasis protein CutC [Fuscibacter oryzae]|uniref:PF03932 family protein CutC n=1 Tax=Fuscibacter oryzae TaxID=2803939 RepID=A0A8J7MTV7_9RHOB|nr:copper homeostasis protein CutC [Fuscibacter oryzae]MBL4927319.1 copper homeostasis protein CutC [Fuscibacter oryzae]
MPATLEICVDTVAGLTTCRAAGVDRIELCSALDLGGLSPGTGLLHAAQGNGAVHVMIRPRAGDFLWSAAELDLICAEIATIRSMGLAGVVIGAATATGALDVAALARMMQAARGLSVTLHRVVDLLPDPVHAVAVAADLGIDRILTSGGAARAADGAATLARMVQAAAGRVEVMVGSGVTAALIPQLAQATGARSFHASGGREGAVDPRLLQMGFALRPPRQTDPAQVQALLAAVRALP